MDYMYIYTIWSEYNEYRLDMTIHNISSLLLSYLLNDMYMDKIRFHPNINERLWMMNIRTRFYL
jgi:hypothetical protein